MELHTTVRPIQSFAAMAVHIGQLLRDLYLNSGLKMERFRDGIPYSDKTIYYHFSKEHLNTEILENYEIGLKKLGIEVDIWSLIARRRKGYTLEEALGASTASEPIPTKELGAVELLRRAADILEKERSATALDRDKRPYQHD